MEKGQLSRIGRACCRVAAVHHGDAGAGRARRKGAQACALLELPSLPRKEICWNYIKTWFFIDLVASFPYNYLILEDESVDAVESSLNKTP